MKFIPFPEFMVDATIKGKPSMVVIPTNIFESMRYMMPVFYFSSLRQLLYHGLIPSDMQYVGVKCNELSTFFRDDEHLERIKEAFDVIKLEDKQDIDTYLRSGILPTDYVAIQCTVQNVYDLKKIISFRYNYHFGIDMNFSGFLLFSKYNVVKTKYMLAIENDFLGHDVANDVDELIEKLEKLCSS